MTSDDHRVRRWPLAGAAAAVALLVLAGHFQQRDGALLGPSSLTAVFAAAFTACGGLVLAGVAGHPVGRLMLAAGLLAVGETLALSWSSWLPLAWLAQWLWWPPYALVFLALLIFPDGRLPGPRWRAVAAVLVGCAAISTAGFAAAAVDDPGGLLLTGELAATGRAQLLVQLALVAIAGELLAVGAVLWSLVRRWRRARGETRQQLACLLVAGALFLLGLVLDGLDLAGAWVLMVVAVPGGLTLAVLRYRLYQLEQVINRTLVWSVMSLLVIAGFVATVALLRDLLLAGDTSNASLAATGLVAVAFEPVRHRVQRGVNRLLYGDRDDPYGVLTRLGGLLANTVRPHAVPALLTGTIARSLRVPYVAVEVEDPAGADLADAVYGQSTGTTERFDMVTHGEQVGQLVVAHRRPGDRFTPVERRLLSDVARHASVAVATARLIRELRDSRERLVLAREEERRRLRRDLHDGLGPTFAGMSMQVRAASKLVAGSDRLGSILDELAEELRICTAEVRRLVDQLRPAALDQGLRAALRTECQRFDGPGLRVRLHVGDDLRVLPAAVEVAAYRIVAEALSNVARHARAGRCEVRVGRDGGFLLMEVVDDGVGAARPRPGGVGLDSIRQRAVELGGSCEIGDRPDGGTAVRVRLPWPDHAQGDDRSRRDD
ncbi:GAF domain-containing sensor histidine kinase [Micromonospora endolithica]|uniref:GAF domain-containing sensor histidine kinase n=1 Tax=Micromonospora endolithica TaxID=230091 RepID=UPI0011ADB3EE|nr:sensor histidine kinase [Micromonospora endolithica]TWJ21274.1 signal transduction histidine kinase [Micromonospora endolithica]